MPRGPRPRAVRLIVPLIILLVTLVIVPPAQASPPTQTTPPNCSPQALVHLPGVRAPDPRLNAPATASFAQVRQAIIARTGQDVLTTLADVLRAPGFRCICGATVSATSRCATHAGISQRPARRCRPLLAPAIADSR